MKTAVILGSIGVFVAVVAQGCGGRSGEVSCGSHTCTAGTYCADVTSFGGTCATGCTSNNNCANGETCTKTAGSDVGSCISATAPASTNPGTTGTPGCIAVPEMDSKCAGTGTKAYRCNPTDKGPSGCPAHPDQKTYPGGYCCP